MIFTGEVVHGAGRGRSVGFPTVNVRVDAAGLEYGVYAVWVLLGEGGLIEQKKYSSVMNWGGRPTFGEEVPVLEIHLFDFEGEVYGQQVQVEVGPRLRGVQRFAGVEALRAQLSRDVARAREFFRSGTLPPERQ